MSHGSYSTVTSSNLLTNFKSVSSYIMFEQFFTVCYYKLTICILVAKNHTIGQKLNRRIKFEALASCDFPCLTYGYQTWNLTRKQKKHFQVCQRKMEWKILGISLRDRIPNTRIRELAKADDMAGRAEILKWKWGGHVARLQSIRWAQISTMWDPCTGRKQRGRSARRWMDSFGKITGVHWSRAERNRSNWRTLQREDQDDHVA